MASAYPWPAATPQDRNNGRSPESLSSGRGWRSFIAPRHPRRAGPTGGSDSQIAGWIGTRRAKPCGSRLLHCCTLTGSEPTRATATDSMAQRRKPVSRGRASGATGRDVCDAWRGVDRSRGTCNGQTSVGGVLFRWQRTLETWPSHRETGPSCRGVVTSNCKVTVCMCVTGGTCHACLPALLLWRNGSVGY